MEELNLSPYNINGFINLKKDIHIYDTTLASYNEKRRILNIINSKKMAHILNDMQIEDIVVGTPYLSDTEKIIVKEIKKLDLISNAGVYANLTKGSIDSALDTDADFLLVNIPVSEVMLTDQYSISFDEHISRVKELLEYIRSHGIRYGVILNDCSRAYIDNIKVVTDLAINFKAERVEIEDTAGVLNPDGTSFLIKNINGKNRNIGIRAYNNFGLALANSIEALKYGANWVSASLYGAGFKSGITSLEQIIMALKYLYNVDLKIDMNFIEKGLHELAKAMPKKHITHVPK
ncbi:MAG: hypothetical protein M1481_04605 [Candidatus Thermoplasmatota archaeon]|jgi:isopropylmalate/homocitrate/citramalate synthase|nr:hypothetical protein [Candidatus Thermoplasmatota archaeon]MCL5963915.1 hypothetical protein [Candidatus Thermoplasmatota archaeon]